MNYAILFLFTCLMRNGFAEEPTTPTCPRECTCETAPLRSAPFVLTWMTSWGEDDVPDIHPNDVLDAGMMTSSLTASDANVDVDVIGLHVTCSLHSTTNITSLLSSIPPSTMVLSILQAPGCNLTIVDGGQLAGLNSIKALHLQGYAHTKERQISGFEPNNIPELNAHRKLVEQEKHQEKRMKELRLALAEDALQPLTSLELLDLQFVRLVASKEARRSRRYSKEPIASTTLLDMPLKQFLKFANTVDSFHLPSHLQHLNSEQSLHEILEDDDDRAENRINFLGDSYKLQRKSFERNEQEDKTPLNYDVQFDPSKGQSGNSVTDENIVPYSIYKAEIQPQLAPFKTLKKLKYLRVAHARLDRIGAELLDGLQHLHTLTLEYNRIKILPNGLFGPTPNLRHLSLAHNSVLILERDSLEGLSKLLTIDLDYNELSVIGPASFPHLPSLKTIRINENPLTQLLPDTFAALNATESIFLGSNDISMDVHENSFRFLFHIKNLVLNNITTKALQKTLLMGMPNVHHLTIHGKLHEVDYDAFSSTPFLRSLNLSNCHLNYLSLDAFYGLKYLRKLDLSFNELVAISPGTFDHLTSLRELYLHNNLLTTLPLGIFVPIPARLIQLNNNPWICTCDLLQLRPSITNKVKRPGHVVCKWDDKLASVCKKTKDRLVYDARVAPLCNEPFDLVGNDVYHAALRHLKCSKYHWDPRLLPTQKEKESSTSKQAVDLKDTTDFVDTVEKEELEEKKPNWLPLTAFTPEPIDTEDLLEIAEREGLEEVIESPKTKDLGIVSSDSSFTGQSNVQNEINPVPSPKNVPQNDQPSSSNPEKVRKPITDEDLTQKLALHKQQKAKLKLQLKKKTMRRKYKKWQNLKKHHFKEKSHLKLMIASGQKKMLKHSRKMDNTNNYMSNDLKSNVDIY